MAKTKGKKATGAKKAPARKGGAAKAPRRDAGYGYTDKHLGPKEEIGNKGGSLSNRLRAEMA